MELEAEFDEQQAKEIVDNLSFPRLVGSEGGDRVIKLIQDKFKEIKIDLQREEFMATKFWTATITNAGTFLAFVLSIVMLILSIKSPAWNLLIIFLILSLAIWGLGKMRGKGGLKIIGTPLPTANLMYKIPSTQKPQGKIIFMGHHDTKSQVLTTVQRSAGFTIGGLGLLIMVSIFAVQGLLILFSITLPFGFRIIGYIGWVIVICCTIPLTLNFTQNKSPGALDNASSIAAVYLLGNYFQKHPLQNHEVWLLLTGAEEVGMLGVQAFVKAHSAELIAEKTYAINFDMIGRVGEVVQVLEFAGFPKAKPICPSMVELARDIAKRMNYDFRGFTLPVGAATDGYVLRDLNIATMDFINRKAAYETHSVNDTPKQFDPKLAKKFIVIAAAMAQEIDVNNNAKFY